MLFPSAAIEGEIKTERIKNSTGLLSIDTQQFQLLELRSAPTANRTNLNKDEE